MKINKYNFYIGWNNRTHKREFKKAIKVLINLNVVGFNLNKDVLGYWNKEKENSFNIEIIATPENRFNDNKAKDLKKLLEKNLKQFLVLTTKQQIEII